MSRTQPEAMRFFVRYWSSLLPSPDFDGEQPHWIDYSVHPATKLGLHNALLVVHDRLEILKAHGGTYGCAVFVVDRERCEMLLPEVANALFPHLAPGNVRWLDIQTFRLPAVVIEAEPPNAESTVSFPADLAEQQPLFPTLPTPYDAHPTFHQLDVEV